MLAGRCFLVVEDEVLILLDLETVLRGAGAEVFSASSLAAARKIVETQSLDAALLDVHLKSDQPLAGDDCEKIANCLQRDGVPFAFLTAELDMDGWKNAFHVPLLKKPYRPEDILAIARQLLLSRSSQEDRPVLDL